jgi:hypothetical protein
MSSIIENNATLRGERLPEGTHPREDEISFRLLVENVHDTAIFLMDYESTSHRHTLLPR